MRILAKLCICLHYNLSVLVSNRIVILGVKSSIGLVPVIKCYRRTKCLNWVWRPFCKWKNFHHLKWQNIFTKITSPSGHTGRAWRKMKRLTGSGWLAPKFWPSGSPKEPHKTQKGKRGRRREKVGCAKHPSKEYHSSRFLRKKVFNSKNYFLDL